MLEFGNLEIVEKTFTREGGATREQAYHGVKFRRYESEIGKKTFEAENPGQTFVPHVKEQFIVSNTVFEKFGLEDNALTQAKFGVKVFLLVVEDQDAVKPEAKILRRSFNKADKTPLDKGKMFSNDFLSADLIEIGVLDKDQHGNQYLSVKDVSAEVTGLPAHVKAVYEIGKDSTVDASKDEEAAIEKDKF